MTELYGHVVFSVGTAEYRWEDLVIAADFWGDWDRLRQRVREGLACLQRLDDEEPELDAEIAAAAHEFRYARDLIGTQELEAWLERWGLTADEWIDCIAASFLRRTWSAELGDLVSEYAASDEEVDAGIKTEGICSGEFARWARNLAARVAVHDREQHESPAALDADNNAKGILQEFRSRSGTGSLGGISVEAAQPIIERITRLESSYGRFRERVVTVDALDSEIRSRQTGWTRLDCQIIAFPEEQEAREAALCVRDDGQRLEEVAAETNRVVRQEPIYVEDVEPGYRDQLLAAQKGELVGPLVRESEFLLYLVLDKVRPSRNDARVAARAEEAVLQRLIDLDINDRVKWHWRF